MTHLRTYKFLVTPVIQQVDEDDTVLAEVVPQQPDVVFGVEGLRSYADGFEEALTLQEARLKNGQPAGGR